MAIRLVYSIHKYILHKIKKTVEATVWLHGTKLISLSKPDSFLQIVYMLLPFDLPSDGFLWKSDRVLFCLISVNDIYI